MNYIKIQYAWQKIEYLKVLSESMKNKPSRAKGKKWMVL
jgi:hypothetical protein